MYFCSRVRTQASFYQTGPALQQRPKGIQRAFHDPREWRGYAFLLQDVRDAHFHGSFSSTKRRKAFLVRLCRTRPGSKPRGK